MIYHSDKEDSSLIVLPSGNEPQKNAKTKKALPWGLSFGDLVKRLTDNKIGCVVGGDERYILMAFEDGLKPQIIPANVDDFYRFFSPI